MSSIAVGFLIVQDIVVVLVMIALTAFGQDTGDHLGVGVALVLLKGVGLLAGIWLMTRFVLPRLLPLVARSQELLVLFGVSYAASVAALSEWLGFSSEVGAFLAGVSLASTPIRDALGARLVSLRDFLLLFFFLDLGARLEFTDAARQITEAVVFSAFVLIGNPLIVIAIMAVMRYPVRVGFLAGLTVAQISEFSLILAATGAEPGTHHQRHGQPHHRGRPDHHRLFDLHDPLLPPALRPDEAVALDIRTTGCPAARARQLARRRRCHPVRVGPVRHPPGAAAHRRRSPRTGRRFRPHRRQDSRHRRTVHDVPAAGPGAVRPQRNPGTAGQPCPAARPASPPVRGGPSP